MYSYIFHSTEFIVSLFLYLIHMRNFVIFRFGQISNKTKDNNTKERGTYKN